MRRRLLRLSLILLPALPAAAYAGPEVRIEQHGDVFVVQAETIVATDAALAWQVLTDYNHLADFVPDMRVSRVISAAGRPVQVEQKGDAGFLFFKFAVEVVLDIEETPPRRLGFRAIRGNMRQMRGEWRIDNAAGGIRLVYAAELEPSFWVPPLIGPAVMRHDIARQFESVAQEISRRQAALTAQPTTHSAK